MKNIWESAETMAIYAQIDLNYYFIEHLQKELSKPRTSLEIMIDDATGYGKERIKKMKDEAISLISEIIECKKKIEAPIERDVEFLNGLKQL